MKWKLSLFTFLGLFLLVFYTITHSKSDISINYEIKIVENQNNQWIGQLYYSSSQTAEYNIGAQIRYKKKPNIFQHIEVNLNQIKPPVRIRLDPLLQSGLVEIKNVTVTYLNQIYNINTSKINLNNSHNIEIIKQNEKSIMLKSIGKDPFIELSHTIQISAVNFHNIVRVFIYTMMIWLFLIFIWQLIKVDLLQEVVGFSIIVIYTTYTLLFLSPGLATYLLLWFAVVMVFLVLYKNPINLLLYFRNMAIFVIIYLFLGYASLYMTTSMASPAYFYTKIPYILLALIIPVGFYKLRTFNSLFYKIALTVLLISMAIFIMLLDHNIIVINNSHFFGLVLERIKWTQKNYMFWYVLLMFGTLSFYTIKNKIDRLLIVGILLLSYFTVFGGYSLSARLSYIVGVILYLCLSFVKIEKKYLLIIIWIFTFYIVFSPIIFALIDFTFLPKLVERDAIYKTSLALIKEHWLFGYGYGSTLQLHIKDFVNMADLPKHYLNQYPGGHPHNLSLLFWLEFGVMGAVFLAYYIHKLLKYIIEATYLYTNQAAILAMVVAFDIITSFSWSIWYPQVLLTFAFFGIMLILSLNIKALK